MITLAQKIQRKVIRRIVQNTIRHLIYFRDENKDKTRAYLKGFLTALWRIDLLTTKNHIRYLEYITNKF